MNIRTITTGISLKTITDMDKIQEAAFFNKEAKEVFEREGYKVQTTRLATNSWEEYTGGFSRDEILKGVIRIEEMCKDLDVSSFSMGYAWNHEKIQLIPDIIAATSLIYCSVKLGDDTHGINFQNVKEAARTIKRISERSPNGDGNFRFCAWCNCTGDIAFFPTAFHEGEKVVFILGLESSCLVMEAFSQTDSLPQAKVKLGEIMDTELKKIAQIAGRIAAQTGRSYAGIDASIAPSIEAAESIAFAYEKLNLGRFGQAGTLAISALITDVIKNLAVKTCGYSGLMLPVCEDVGLAQRAGEETYRFSDLLLYSAVCGCGLDTVPIPGDTSEAKIQAVLLDMASLALKLKKPLSARLFPVPGKKAGEMTSFNSPFLVNSKIIRVD